MRIRTQILAVLVVFALITAVISVLMISTNQELERLNRQGEIAESIALEVGDLGYLSNDYILYREPPQAERWQVQYATISDLIGRLSVDRPEQRTIADNLGVNLRNTRTVFEDIQSSPVPAGGTTTASVQLFWSRMAVQNQGMIFDAGRLEQLLQEEADGLKQTRNLLIVILTGMFVALLLTSYLLFYRRTIESINGLQAGAAIVGSGNLTHVIDESADDEIGDLARAFNRMTRSLNSVTASKVDLEREVAERIQAEVALRESEGRLKGLYSSMSEGLADHQVVYENGKAVDYRITDVNPAYEKITGLSRSRVVGGRASEVYGTGSPPYLDTYAQVASGGTPEHFETYFPHMGKHFAISVFSPEPGRFATVFTDVTERKQAEERIRVSAERLEMAQRAAHAGFWTWEIPTGKLTWTDELYRLFGLSPAGGVSFDTWLAIMHPDDREHAMARVNRAIEEKTFLVNEYRIRIPEGTERWIGAWGSTVYDTSGTPLRMSGICLDITDRKRAEEQIAHLASFPELNPNPVMELNLAGEVVYANPAVARILDHMGLTDPGVFLPGDIGEMHPRLMEGDVRKEVQVGDRMFLETISFAPTTRTYRIYARDITDRILAEKALRESELRYRTVADNTSDWEFWADPEGRFIYCSPSCERITGHPAGEFLADPSLSGNLVHPDDRAMWETHVQEEKERQTEDTGVWRLRHPDGSWRWIHHVCQPVYGDGGKFLGTRGSNRDITERVLAEEALRETSQYLENLINHANAPIIVWDPQFLITRFNHAFERLTGRTAGEVMGKDLGILFPDERKSESMDHIRRTMGGERWEAVEIPILTKDGEVRTVLWNSATLYGPDGRTVSSTIAQGQDITERKRAEEALRENEEHFKRLYQGLPISAVVFQRAGEDFVIRDYNPASQPFIGGMMETFVGKTARELYRSRPDILEKFDRAWDTKTTQTLQSRYRMVSTGQDIFLSLTLAYVPPDRILSLSEDNTELRKYEWELRETSQYLENLINHANAPIIVWDPQYRITRFNHAFERLTGRTAGEVMGKDLGILFPEVSKKGAMDCIRRTMDGERWEAVEIPVLTKDGEVRTVLWNSATLYGPDGKTVESAIAQGQDITERKRMEDMVVVKAAELAAANIALRDEITQRVQAGEALERTMSLLKATFESTADGILSIDLDGTVGGFNQNFVAMWSVPFALLQSPDEPAFLQHMAAQLADPEGFMSSTADLRTRMGRESYDMLELRDGRIFERDSRPQRIGHDIVGRVWSYRDITERKRAEERLLASLNEKEVLLREIHHRVKNNLQLISGLLDLTRLRTRDPGTLGILTDMMLKIQTMAQIHTRLYESKRFDRINMGTQIRDQIASLAQIYGQRDREILCEMDLADLYLPIDQAIPCALAVNEILSNAYKHAFRGRAHGSIHITASREDSRVRIVVRDDGRGIPPEFDIAQSRSLGLKLIRNLVENQLKGSLAIHRAGGTEVIVEFPILTQEENHVKDTGSGR